MPLFEYRDDTSHALLRAAVAELNALSGYIGPRHAKGQVTPLLLFRGTARCVDKSDRAARAC